MQSAAIAVRLNQRAEAEGWPMRCDGDLVFERPELAQLCKLWLERATDGVPTRAALDIRTLKPYASHLIILERCGEGARQRYRFRLFGSSLVLLFGEHTGRFLDEMVTPALLPNWQAFYDCVLENEQPFRFINYYRIPTQDYLRGEILAAPLADEDGRVRLVLAATYVGLNDGVLPPSR